ncbi:hypothetical protein [Leuconostoc fallax]|uniref:hypothetical protein n=1 Tax=Leuconostoc fallax TaxID=1251 RepID=UPI00031ED2F7|nr:hypothetical protein [Leuconostoc fallax]
MIYGTAYYGYEHTRLLRVVIAVILVSIIINLISNTLWLQMMYHPISNWQTFYAFITPRLIKQIIFVPIQILITYIFLNNAIIKHLITELFNKKAKHCLAFLLGFFFINITMDKAFEEMTISPSDIMTL